MATEVMIDYDMQTPEKKKVKKVASMKNNAMYEAPNPFRNKAELMEYKKKIEKLYKPGYGEMGYKERPVSEMVEMLEKKSITPKSKPKTKTTMMKKLGKTAGEVIDKLDDKSIKETMLKQTAPMEKLISKPIMESKMADNMKKDMPEAHKRTQKDLEEIGSKISRNSMELKPASKFEPVMAPKDEMKKEDVMMAPSLRYATDEEIKESRSKPPAKKDLNDKVNNEVNSIFSEMKKRKLESLKKPAPKYE